MTRSRVFLLLSLLCIATLVQSRIIEKEENFVTKRSSNHHLSGLLSANNRRTSLTRKQLLFYKLRQIGQTVVVTGIQNTDSNGSTEYIAQTVNNSTYNVSSSVGSGGVTTSGTGVQYYIVPSSSPFYRCNYVFNALPIRWDSAVNKSLNSFLGELSKNSGVLSVNQSCSLLYYWRKRIEEALMVSDCSSGDPWCKSSYSFRSEGDMETKRQYGKACTPLYCTKNPGASCTTMLGFPGKCLSSFTVRCVIHCLKLRLKTSDPTTLTKIVNQLQNLQFTKRNDQSSYVKGNLLQSLLMTRQGKEKKQAMALSCSTCGCGSGGYTCDACYTGAPNGAACWDPYQNADCCMCLVLG